MTITQYQRTEYPTPDVPEPLEGTLLSVVTPQEMSTSARALINSPEALFPSYSCLVSGVELAKLCGPLDSSKFEDVPSPGWVDGIAFGAYGAVVCKLVEEDEIRTGVDLAYDAAETRVIERGLLALMEENDGSVLPGGWDAAVDITPASLAGVGVDPQVGLALLESHMGANYAGKGIIHATRSVASMLTHLGALEWSGNQLITKLRTPFAAGPGYDLPNVGPDGTDAPEGTKWMYATGNVVIRKLRLPTHVVFNIFGQDSSEEDPNYVPGLEPNDTVGLAEGVYLVAVDCYKAAVLVKLYEEA